ncbi:concanavalin A-like lectin/glucanase superfamily protein [Mucilaginibacter yixingensis]|uniref:Concanavalin A-like lectin/glucanase superfamily protein n=1 Tax=Mucilaginibacter yixingensis TaxID=1295612 RepID=A0A2T5JAL9_9SPHI|nr:glycosyl hydrolase [Mucilaginibacter yixingensis]PTQ97914.1 concanavalin A-like lectin/glucanase superfamily protein [Mucilaginibacter yixingensis]
MDRRKFLKTSAAAGMVTLITPTGIVHALTNNTAPDDLALSFANPPQNAHAFTWWHWMNGHITKKGITLDLEAMKEIGLGGFQNFNAGTGIPKGPIEYLSPKWLELTKHAISEANRLGLQYQMHNCPGWSSSGGPWITPELSMQKVTLTETIVTGGKKVSVTLPEPLKRLNYYQDTFVIAYPSLANERQEWYKHLTKISSSAGDVDILSIVHGNAQKPVVLPWASGKPGYMLLEFSEPLDVSSVFVYADVQKPTAVGKQFPPDPVIVEVSNDGQQYKEVDTMHSVGAETPGSGIFAPVNVRYVKLTFNGEAHVSQLQLFTTKRIEEWEDKANYGPMRSAREFDVPDDNISHIPENDIIDPEKVIDISAFMDKNGQLNWDAPEGTWTVLRMGHTPTGRFNKSAPTTGEGLECDKYSKAAFDYHFDKMFEHLLPAFQQIADKSTIGVLIDSYEVGFQNWTKGFEKEFKANRGYDITKYLPALTGRAVGSAEDTERFLWDFRRVQADLMADNYYGRCTERCHENGFLSYTEPYNGGPFDELQAGSRMDVNMGEFWVRTFQYRHSVKLAASVQHVNGRKIVGAESFTGYAMFSKWQEYPFALKAYGDLMYTKGLNRFIFHRFAHQPHPDVVPGMTMGPWGIHFDRTITWWKPGKAWLNYVARCQHVLQQGLFNADLLYYTNADAPGQDLSNRPSPSPEPPAGYDFDYINTESLLKQVSVKNGRIMLPDGMSYRMLILPDRNSMPLNVAERLHELVQQGLVIYGRKPLRPTGLGDNKEKFAQITAALWGDFDGKTTTSRSFGKGKIFWGHLLKSVLTDLSIAPDFSCSTPTTDPCINYIHRSINNTEVYFVANGRRREENAVCTFRVSGLVPELWDADTGTMHKITAYETGNGFIKIPLQFDPSGSVFIVFSKKAAANNTLLSVSNQTASLVSFASPKQLTPANHAELFDTFSMVAWIKPECDVVVPNDPNNTLQKFKGTSAVFSASQDGSKLYGEGHAVCGMTAGRNGFVVYERSGGRNMDEVLSKPVYLSGWTHIALVYQNGIPSVYINGKLVNAGTASSGLKVHPGIYNEFLDEEMTFFEGDLSGKNLYNKALTPDEIAKLAESRPMPTQPAISFNSAHTNGLLFWKNGAYDVKLHNGKTERISINNTASSPVANQPWKVSFPPNLGAPASIVMPKLQSLHLHPENGVKYFSGTASYHNQFHINDLPKKDQRVFIDLGEVEVIAEVIINGKQVATLWKQPFITDIARFIKQGTNQLEIKVTNLWPNRLIGDEQLPNPYEYTVVGNNQRGGIKTIPDWYVKGEPKPNDGRITFTTWKHYGKDAPLLASGLVGPVVIHTAVEKLLD